MSTSHSIDNPSEKQQANRTTCNDGRGFIVICGDLPTIKKSPFYHILQDALGRTVENYLTDCGNVLIVPIIYPKRQNPRCAIRFCPIPLGKAQNGLEGIAWIVQNNDGLCELPLNDDFALHLLTKLSVPELTERQHRALNKLFSVKDTLRTAKGGK